MVLTESGQRSLQLSKPEKQNLAHKLIMGNDDVILYQSGNCYDAVAFVRFLMGANISVDELKHISGQGWVQKLFFAYGRRWNGLGVIPEGTAIGFYYSQSNRFFHSAIATGGNFYRGINGHSLGNFGWNVTSSIQYLGQATGDRTYKVDNLDVWVFLSDL